MMSLTTDDELDDESDYATDDEQTTFGCLHQEQIEAGNKIIRAFNRFDYVLLLAQMQSGKSDTTRFVIAELLRKGMVEAVVLMSSMTDVALKLQTSNHAPFLVSYREYLKHYCISEFEIDIAITKFQEKYNIYWGASDMKKLKTAVVPTLYVQEESSRGQDKEMSRDNCLKLIGLSEQVSKGKCTSELNHKMLSISATPFAEEANISNREHNPSSEQYKIIVRLKVNSSYIGVEQFRQNIHCMEKKPMDMVSKIVEEQNKTKDFKYIIVRADSKKYTPLLESTCKVIKYNMHNKIKLNHYLNTEPTQPTIIFVQGMLRMGNELPCKDHIGACMECSVDIAIDTFLQSLFGRCCGYNSNPNIQFYVFELTQKRLSELDTYMENFQESGHVSKILSGAHVKLTNHSSENYYNEPIVPIKHSFSGQKTRPNVINALKAYALVEPNVAIREKLDKVLHSGTVKPRYSGGTFDEAIPLIRIAHDQQIKQCKFGSGNGVSPVNSEVHVYIDGNSMYIVTNINTNITVTDGKEIYKDDGTNHPS